jgi:hypothetical protein
MASAPLAGAKMGAKPATTCLGRLEPPRVSGASKLTLAVHVGGTARTAVNRQEVTQLHATTGQQRRRGGRRSRHTAHSPCPVINETGQQHPPSYPSSTACQARLWCYYFILVMQ